jgi:HEAT repeat protein
VRENGGCSLKPAKTALRWLLLLCLCLAGATFSQQPDVSTKPWTPLILHPVKDAATHELLRAALAEADPVVRERALEALGVIRDVADAARVRALLNSDSTPTRQQAAKTATLLGQSPPPAQQAELSRVLPARDTMAAIADALRGTNLVALIRALHSLDAEAARREASTLTTLLRRPEVAVREAAVRAVQRGQVVAAGGGLLPLLEDADEGLRLASAETLAGLFDSVPRPQLTAAMVRRLELDPSSQVRRAAGLTLVALHDGPARAALLRLLAHARGVTRASAAEAVGVWGEVELAGALHPLLTDREDLVARAAAHALGRLRNAESKAPLLAAFETRGPVVQERAAWALGELRSTNAVPALAALLPKTTDEALKVSVVAALGKIGDKRALPPLREVLLRIVLTNNLPKAREAAFTALTGFGDKPAIPRAVQMVTTPVVPPFPGAGPTYDEDYIRIAALRFLGAVGDRAAGAALLAGLKDPVPRDVRPAVAEALGKLLGRSYTPVPDEDYRRYFIESTATRVIQSAPPPGVALAP